MEDIQNSSMIETLERQNLEEGTENYNGQNDNQVRNYFLDLSSIGDTLERENLEENNGQNDNQVSNETSSDSRITNSHGNLHNIRFIDDADSQMVLSVQQDKIIELQNVESYVDNELLVTAETIKALFLQFTALQRHILRRHLKVCKNMIKDLDHLVECLNEETFPLRSHIEDELQLWKQELEKTYERILNLKEYFYEAVTHAEVLDYSMVASTPLFTMCLKNTRSILHGNYELSYTYLSDAHKMQKSAIRSLEDVIGQHKVFECLISKISEALPTTSRLIFKPRTDNSDLITRPFVDNVINRFNNVRNRSLSAPNLTVIPEENLHPQQSEENGV